MQRANSGGLCLVVFLGRSVVGYDTIRGLDLIGWISSLIERFSRSILAVSEAVFMFNQV